MKVADTENPTLSPNLNSSRLSEILVFFAMFLVPWLLMFLSDWILPWHSGAASVWMLVLGFGICVGAVGWILGTVLTSRFSALSKKVPQFILLVGMLVSLPVAPGNEWVVAAPDDAAKLILQLLAIKAGPALLALSYFVGSRFMAAKSQEEASSGLVLRSALLGIVASLVVYLFLLGPVLTLNQHNLIYSWCVLVFALSGGWWVWREIDHKSPVSTTRGRIDWGQGILHFGLSGAITAFLLVVTLRFQRDAVSVPTLWAVPLLVFSVCGFLVLDRSELLNRRVLLVLFLGAVSALTASFFVGGAWGFGVKIALHSLALAFACLICFSILFKSTKGSIGIGALNRFFAGAILGTVAIVLIAPRVSTGYTEYQVTLFALCTLLWLSSMKLEANEAEVTVWSRLVRMGGGAVVLALGFALYTNVYGRIEGVKGRIRTFHGVTSSVQVGVPPKSYMIMMVGDHPRAAEFMSPELRLAPTFWQGPATGVGLMFRALPKGNFRKIGVIGVGNGGMMGYLDGTDALTFYEYDAGAVVTANQQFAYFPNALIDYDFVPGDPRLSLAESEPQKFDVLILDSLNAESLPVHLITKEAFEIWDKHLAEDGVMAVNITNNKFDLAPVIWRQALELGWETILIANPDDPQNLSAAAEWLILTQNTEFLRKGNFRPPTAQMSEAARQFPLWADRFNNPLSLLK